jgi:hypothetical protein
MSQWMPANDFRWMNEDELQQLETQLKMPDSPRLMTLAYGPVETRERFIAEVDLEYPAGLHDRDDDFPMAPENIYIRAEMLSTEQVELKRRYYPSGSCKTGVHDQRKLVCSFLQKKHYIVHSDNLAFYLLNGMKLTKVGIFETYYQYVTLRC